MSADTHSVKADTEYVVLAKTDAAWSVLVDPTSSVFTNATGCPWPSVAEMAVGRVRSTTDACVSAASAGKLQCTA